MGWVARFAESYKRNENQLCVFSTTEPISLAEISGPRYQVSSLVSNKRTRQTIGNLLSVADARKSA